MDIYLDIMNNNFFFQNKEFFYSIHSIEMLAKESPSQAVLSNRTKWTVLFMATEFLHIYEHSYVLNINLKHCG